MPCVPQRYAGLRGVVILLLTAINGFSDPWIEVSGDVSLFNNNWKVGIGTSNPGLYKLKVAGNSIGPNIYSVNTYTNPENVVEINSAYRGIAIFTHGNGVKALQAEGEATGNNQTVYGVYGIARPYSTIPYSNLTCYAGYFDADEWTSSGNFWSVYAKGDKNYFEGKVGIGTTTPSVKLDVNGTIKSTNPCAKGYRNANTAFGPSWTWNKITLNREMYDVGENFAAGTFTAPTTGYYQVNASIQFYSLTTGAGSVVCAAIWKNGNFYSYVRLGVHTNEMSVNVSDIVQMNAGDYVELYGFYSGGGTCRIAGNSLTTTYMSVRLAQ